MSTRLVLMAGLCLLVPASGLADIDARIFWAQRIEMGVPVSGVVEKVPVNTGMRLKKGEVMLVLEQTPFTTALTEAQAALVQAAGVQKESRRDYTQTQELYDRGLVSNVELENAKLRKEAGEAAYRAAMARVKRAKYELSRSVLRAPFDGLVLSKKVDVGETLISTQQVQTVLTFAAEGVYVARGLAGASDVKALSLGKKVTVKAAGNSFSGVIDSLGLEPVAESKPDKPRYEVAVRFLSNDVLLRAGTEAEIKF
jgi:multidrug efflux system membrane fusion protein